MLFLYELCQIELSVVYLKSPKAICTSALLSGAKVHLYLLSVFITSNTNFVYHPPLVFVTSRKVFGRKCIRKKPVSTLLSYFSGAKLEKVLETTMN